MSNSENIEPQAGTKEAGAPASAAPPEAPRKRERGRSMGRKLFLLLYAIFLIALTAGLFFAVEYYAYLKIKASPLGEAYKGKDLDLARQSSQKLAPQYGYEPTPGFVAVRNTRLGNSFEFINEQSFKDFEDVPIEKPADEYRVFVTGGSVVYGRGPVPPTDSLTDYYEVTYRWTIPHLMEQILNADPAVRAKIGGKRVRVINAGVAGYIYQNNLMRYLAKLRLYNPDLVVALDGANEVHTVARPLRDWNYFTQGPYYEIIIDVMDMGRKGFLNYMALWLKRNTYFFTWLAMRKGEGPGTILENVGFSSHAQDPTPDMIEMRNRNIDQAADVMAIYHTALKTDRVPHVFALQPMLRNTKKPLTPMERKIKEMTGMEKIGFFYSDETYREFVSRVKKRGLDVDFQVVDLTGIYDSVSEWVFTDWCHLTNGANYLIAKALSAQVKEQVFGLTPDQYDTLQSPYDSYFTDYAAKANMLVDDKPYESGLRALKGYPGPDLLELPETSGKSPTVTLDLGALKPVSRLRVVWGDTKSVPGNWRVEVSENGVDWKPWAVFESVKPDRYDQWPGIEHYTHEETPARYVRYVQSVGPVKLRQFSVFR
jgi:hypothetical protein